MALPKIFILDVDGVLTSGSFFYSKEGKLLKLFGPDDNDGLKLINQNLEIVFITGDKKGFEISRKRIVDDMGYPLFLVSTINRIDWIQKRYNPDEVIYMGDGIFDSIVMRKVGYSISPSNADEYTKKCADFITKRSGGDRAVAEACIHILMKFYGFSDRAKIINNNFKDISEAWVG